MTGDWSTTWWYRNQLSEADDADRRFAEQVLVNGNLPVQPYIGYSSRLQLSLEPLDGYMCEVLADWFGSKDKEGARRSGAAASGAKKRRKRGRAKLSHRVHRGGQVSALPAPGSASRAPVGIRRG